MVSIFIFAESKISSQFSWLSQPYMAQQWVKLFYNNFAAFVVPSISEIKYSFLSIFILCYNKTNYFFLKKIKQINLGNTFRPNINSTTQVCPQGTRMSIYQQKKKIKKRERDEVPNMSDSFVGHSYRLSLWHRCGPRTCETHASVKRTFHKAIPIIVIKKDIRPFFLFFFLSVFISFSIM